MDALSCADQDFHVYLTTSKQLILTALSHFSFLDNQYATTSTHKYC